MENEELIHLLEDNHAIPTKTVCKDNKIVESFDGCFEKSIKCNHNEIVNSDGTFIKSSFCQINFIK